MLTWIEADADMYIHANTWIVAANIEVIVVIA